jgi:hypothetical protein
MSIANGQTVLKIGEAVLTSLPFHHQSKPLYPVPTHDNGWQCIDGMIEPK